MRSLKLEVIKIVILISLEIYYKQLSYSTESNTLESKNTLGKGVNKSSSIKLPNLTTNPDPQNLPIFEKRFNSVKKRGDLSRSKLKEDRKKSNETPVITSLK